MIFIVLSTHKSYITIISYFYGSSLFIIRFDNVFEPCFLKAKMSCLSSFEMSVLRATSLSVNFLTEEIKDIKYENIPS